MKKFASLALTLALTASLAAPAFAAEDLKPTLISAPLTYAYEITVNGVKLDTAKLPAADENYVPLRAIAEADHGSAGWYDGDTTASFYMGDFRVSVDFADSSITVGDVKLDAPAILKNGVTYVPASVFEGAEGYTVNLNPELNVNRIDITTPNNAPIVKLGYSIVEAVNLPDMRNPDSQLESFFDIKTENYTEIASFLPMMNIKSTSLFVAKVADGKMADAKAELKVRQDALVKSFEQYLRDQYDLAVNGKIVTEGDYILFVISEDNDTAIKLFKDYVAEQK